MTGKSIKASILGAGALVLASGTAFAADMPVYSKAPSVTVAAKTPFAVEYEGWVATDYIFRGTSQSNRSPSAGASATAVWYETFYLGVAGAAISWPDRAPFFLSDPSAEIDFFGGVRWSYGKWSFDVGAIYYYYPKEVNFDSDFWEVHGSVEYAVSDQLTVGGSLAYSPDYLNYGISGTAGALNFTWTTAVPSYKDLEFYVSAEVGYVWLGGTPSGGLYIPDYAHWNAGFGWNWKNLTLDLRYHDTDRSAAGCQAIWNAHGSTGLNKWCSPAYVAKLSFAGSTAD